MTYIFLVRNAPKDLARMRESRNPLLRPPPSYAGISAELPNTRDRRAETRRSGRPPEKLLRHPLAFAIAEANSELGTM